MFKYLKIKTLDIVSSFELEFRIYNKIMKKLLWIIIVLVVVWGIWFRGEKPAPVVNGTPIKIGAILPLTGPIASAGEFAKEGIELAVEDLKAEGKAVEVSFEDYGYDSKNAVSVFNKLKTTSDPDALIVFGTNGAMPLSPLVNADQLPMLGLLAAVNYSTLDDYTYRMFGSADFEAKFASDVLVDQLGKKKIAVMYLNNDYGQSALTAFKKHIGDRATVVAEEGSAPGTADYRSQLTKIKATNPDGIFLATLYREAGTILKQAKEMGINVPFMCGQPCDAPELFTTAGPAAEGLLVTAPTNKANVDFIETYTKKYQQDFLSYITVRHYDAIKVLSFVSEACESDDYSGPCLKKQLDDVTNFPGLSYQINFDQNGDINDQFTIQIAKGGKYVPYQQ